MAAPRDIVLSIWWIIISLLAAIAIFIVIIVPVSFGIPPVSSFKLKQVKVGMSKDEVKAILGAPSVEHNRNMSYSGIGFSYVHVYFDEHGKVKEVVKD